MCTRDPYYPAPPMAPPPWAVSSTATVTIAPMPAIVTPVEQPESASVRLLRSLLADRQRTKSDAESERTALDRTADEYDRAANNAREGATAKTAVIDAASKEIAAILLDIEKLGGKPE